MRFLAAMALSLAVMASGAHEADAHARKKGYSHASKRVKSHAAKRVKPQVRGYYFRGGGYSQGYALEPYLRQNGPYGYYPYFDNRTFWERVQSSPFDSRPGVSAF